MSSAQSNTSKNNSDDEPQEEMSKMMSLFDHLAELRNCFIKSFAAVLIFFVIAMVFSNEIIAFLKTPLVASLPENANNLHFTGPLDVFLTSIRVSFLTAMVAACPVWLFQFWKFIEPALYDHEKKYISPFIVASIALFMLGVSFCFYVILPMAMDFLIGMGLEVGTPIITITDYTSLLTIMIFGFGIVFETPLILVLLAFLDLLSAKSLIDFRKFVVIFILFLSAMLTPPDPMSQVGMAVPLYIMYEGSILIIRFIEKRRATP